MRKKFSSRNFFASRKSFGLNFSGLWEMNLIYCHCSKKVKNLNKLKKSVTYVISLPFSYTHYIFSYFLQERTSSSSRCNRRISLPFLSSRWCIGNEILLGILYYIFSVGNSIYERHLNNSTTITISNGYLFGYFLLSRKARAQKSSTQPK